VLLICSIVCAHHDQILAARHDPLSDARPRPPRQVTGAPLDSAGRRSRNKVAVVTGADGNPACTDLPEADQKKWKLTGTVAENDKTVISPQRHLVDTALFGAANHSQIMLPTLGTLPSLALGFVSLCRFPSIYPVLLLRAGTREKMMARMVTTRLPHCLTIPARRQLRPLRTTSPLLPIGRC